MGSIRRDFVSWLDNLGSVVLFLGGCNLLIGEKSSAKTYPCK